MDWLKTLISNHTFVFFGIVVGVPVIMGTLHSIIRSIIKHRERMAMIERGMHPDHPPEDLRRNESAER